MNKEQMENMIRLWEKSSKRYNTTLLVLEDIVWEKDYLMFLELLEERGHELFYVADTSTALMGTLYLLLGNGYEIRKEAILEEKYHWGGQVHSRKALLLRKVK